MAGRHGGNMRQQWLYPQQHIRRYPLYCVICSNGETINERYAELPRAIRSRSCYAEQTIATIRTTTTYNNPGGRVEKTHGAIEHIMIAFANVVSMD